MAFLIHPWDLSPAEAIALQRELAGRVICQDALGPVNTVAGVDVSTPRGGSVGDAAVVVLALPGLEIVEVAHARQPLTMPYVPGLLSFREVPVVLEAFQTLKTKVDLLIVDGQGRAHPRRFGIACHLGVLLDLPAIGCGKSLLVGRYQGLEDSRGAIAPLLDRGETVGYALRTKNRVQPVYVSCGHKVSPETAVRWVLECGKGYRLPEPTRQAHLAANAFRKGLGWG